jgi:hypothetical protein
LNFSQIARVLHVSRSTLADFCKVKNISLEVGNSYFGGKENQYQKQGRETDELLNSEREYIFHLIETGLTNKYIVEKLHEKGIHCSNSAFKRWLKNDRELHASYIEKIKQIRAVRNKDCGKQKQYYKS